MSLKIAQITNTIGFTDLADRIARSSFGKPVGQVSKTGIRGYSFAGEDGEKVITTVDKNFNILAQVIKSKTGKYFKKDVFDKSGNLSYTVVCSKNPDVIMHTVTTPFDKGGNTGLWAYELKTGKKVVFCNEANILNKWV